MLKNHTLSAPSEDNTTFFDDEYYYFSVYWSPAYDNRQYQEGLTEFEYASWALDYILNTTIEMDYLSMFSSNPSTMAYNQEYSETASDR